MNDHIDDTTGLIDRPPPAPHPFGPASVAQILDAVVTADPNRIALLDGGRRWTYSELDSAVDRAAGALAASGVGRGDRAVWSLPNCAEMVIGFLATTRRAAVWVGLHPRLTAPERASLVADCDPALVIDDLSAWSEAVDDANAAGASDIDPHVPAAFAYTSGTTGVPKGAVHSQHNLLWPGLVSVEMDPPTAHDRTGTPLALTTLNIMVLGPLAAFCRGGVAVVLDRTDAAGFAADVSDARLTRAIVVPTMLHDLVGGDVHPSLLSSLRTILVGGAGTPSRTRDAFTQRFGLTPVLSYGLSEAPTGVARTSADTSRGATALPPISIQIRDPGGKVVAAGVEGEICLVAASSGRWAGSWSPTLGYWRQPELTRELFHAGVLHTGDIGVIDDTGQLEVHGRQGDVIVRGGANVYPMEIERVLLEHADVDTAAVAGVSDSRLGERVVAVVTAAEGSVDIAGLNAHCRERLAPYKFPDTIAVVDELPVDQGGKVRRSALAALASAPVDEAEAPPP